MKPRLLVLLPPRALLALRSVCVASSLALMSAGVPEVARIVATGTSSGVPLEQYLAMGVDAAVGWAAAAGAGDTLGLALRSLSLLLVACYWGVIVVYAPSPAAPARRVARTVAGIAAFAGGVAALVPRARIPSVLGVANVATAAAFAAAPLRGLRAMLARKDASAIPPRMAAAVLVCSVAWGLYGAALGSGWLVAPNALNAGLGALQLGLALAYPGPGPGTGEGLGEGRMGGGAAAGAEGGTAWAGDEAGGGGKGGGAAEGPVSPGGGRRKEE